MGNILESFASGFGNAVGKLFGSPIDFISGKSCGSICGPTWDLMCYIENFCVANLLKLAMVFLLLYFVVLFFYLLIRLGICGCIGRSICGVIWACCYSCFHGCEYCCNFLCYNIFRFKRRRRRRVRRDFRPRFYRESDEEDYMDESLSYHAPTPATMSRSFSYRRRDYKGSHLRKSLRARNHHAQVAISGDLICSHRRNAVSRDLSHRTDATKHGKHVSPVHGIKVTRTSKFVRKGMKNRKRVPPGHKQL